MEQPVHLAKHDFSVISGPQVTLDCGSNHNIVGKKTLDSIVEQRPRLVQRFTTSPVTLSYRFGGGEMEKTRNR
eukprot:1841300-Amphidinium_carterae.1